VLVQEVGRVDSARCGHRVGLPNDCQRSPEDHAVAALHLDTPAPGLSYTTLVDTSSGLSIHG